MGKRQLLAQRIVRKLDAEGLKGEARDKAAFYMSVGALMGAVTEAGIINDESTEAQDKELSPYTSLAWLVSIRGASELKSLADKE